MEAIGAIHPPLTGVEVEDFSQVLLNDDYKEVLNDMCNASEFLIETSKAEGIEIGKAEGIKIGKAEGAVEGKISIYRELVAAGLLPLEVALAKLNMPKSFASYLDDAFVHIAGTNDLASVDAKTSKKHLLSFDKETDCTSEATIL